MSGPREIGDLGRIQSPTGHLFRFLRYDFRLEQAWLAEKLGEHLPAERIAELRCMDEPASMPVLYDLGRKTAALQIKRENLDRVSRPI